MRRVAGQPIFGVGTIRLRARALGCGAPHIPYNWTILYSYFVLSGVMLANQWFTTHLAKVQSSYITGPFYIATLYSGVMLPTFRYISEESSYITVQSSYVSEQSSHITVQSSYITEESSYITVQSSYITEESSYLTQRVTGNFFFVCEAADGAAILVDEQCAKSYKVSYIATLFSYI